MPNYTYACPSHGEFTLNQSMNENHDSAVCPNCKATSDRVFVPFQTYKLDSKLKKKIESGKEPKVVKRDKLPLQQKNNKNPRPWMV